MGRPKLAREEKRDKTVRVSLTKAEQTAVKRAAHKAGLNVADWLRRQMKLDKLMGRRTAQPRKRRSDA